MIDLILGLTQIIGKTITLLILIVLTSAVALLVKLTFKHVIFKIWRYLFPGVTWQGIKISIGRWAGTVFDILSD